MKVSVSQTVPREWSQDRIISALRSLENQLNLLAEGSSAAYHGAAAAAPTTGTWSRGDWVKNSAPSAGGSFGFICVTGGTPGTWKTFGAIAA
jgi:hypothetical protein